MIQDYLEKIKTKNNVERLKAVIYARYSSDNQRSESIDAQKRYIKSFAENNNIIIVGEYIDEAQSARRDDRLEFQHMLLDAKKQGDWQLVLVHKLDRFARNRFDSAAYRVELRKSKKFLISTTEQFDDSPESCMMEAIIEAMAEFYSKNLARETMKGLTENALKGKFCGGFPPLGYDLENSAYVINENEAEAVKYIFLKVAEGVSYRQIVLELNAKGYRTKLHNMFTTNSLYDILRNERYTGTFVYNQIEAKDPYTGKYSRHRRKNDSEVIRVEGAIPQIIPKETFQKVQDILNSRKRSISNNKKEVYILKGKIRCGQCGGLYVGRRKVKNGAEYIQYVCNVRERSVNMRCCNKSISGGALDNYILQAVERCLNQFCGDGINRIYQIYLDNLKSERAESSAKIDTLTNRIYEIDRDLNRIADVISVTSSATLIDKLNNLEKEKLDINARIRNLSCQDYRVLSIEDIKSLFIEAKKMLKEKSIPNLKGLMDLIVKKIIVNEDETVVYLNFSN